MPINKVKHGKIDVQDAHGYGVEEFITRDGGVRTSGKARRETFVWVWKIYQKERTQGTRITLYHMIHHTVTSCEQCIILYNTERSFSKHIYSIKNTIDNGNIHGSG